MKKKEASGQSLVEFALVIPVFLAIMAGLLDGCRLLFTYNELQEAARVGARWGAVEVNRDAWGTFSTAGNYGSSSASSYAGTKTIIGEVASKLVAVDASRTTVTIALPPSPSYDNCKNDTTGEQGTAAGECTGMPVKVSVFYQFRPVLGFGAMGITLEGKDTQDHE